MNGHDAFGIAKSFTATQSKELARLFNPRTGLITGPDDSRATNYAVGRLYARLRGKRAAVKLAQAKDAPFFHRRLLKDHAKQSIENGQFHRRKSREALIKSLKPSHREAMALTLIRKPGTKAAEYSRTRLLSHKAGKADKLTGRAQKFSEHGIGGKFKSDQLTIKSNEIKSMVRRSKGIIDRDNGQLGLWY